MYSATFIFAKGDYDEEFHRLDAEIANAARAIPGYRGEEAWENPENGLICTVYYGFVAQSRAGGLVASGYE